MSHNVTHKPAVSLEGKERPDKVDWSQIDTIVQAELAGIDQAILSARSTGRIRGESNRGGSWSLFSYRVFEPQPETGIDPVVAGVTFTAIKEGNSFSITADISGESLGDVLFEVQRQEVAGSPALIEAAREISRRLVAGSNRIGPALRDTLRRQ